MNRFMPIDALFIAAAVLVLVLAVLFARAVRGTGESRVRRILVPTGFFVFGAMFSVGLPALVSASQSFALTEKTLWFGLGVLVVIGVADGVATVLGAERTRPWLTAGIVGAIVLVCVALVAQMGELFFELSLLLVVPAMLAAAAAISWWPYLPLPEGTEADDVEAAEVFE